MKIHFPGTRGEIDIASKYHRRHSCLLLEGRILIECGADWLGSFGSPEAIILTHAHPDHAGGLKSGADCPVYATAETFERLKSYPPRDRRVVTPGEPFLLFGLRFEAFCVVHSLIAPAIGYRITNRTVAVCYIPDVARIPKRRRVRSGTSLYIGDGASVTRPIVRRRGPTMIGHASVREQLDWCRQAAIRRAISYSLWLQDRPLWFRCRRPGQSTGKRSRNGGYVDSRSHDNHSWQDGYPRS